MPALQGVEACVMVGNKVLDEITDPNEPDDSDVQMTRYVEAFSETPFKIKFNAHHGGPLSSESFMVRIIVDGNTVSTSRHIAEAQQGNTKGFELVAESAVQHMMGKTTEHELHFKDVILEDDDDIDTPLAHVRDLSEIRVELWRQTEVKKRRKTRNRRLKTKIFNEFSSLTEKKLKGRALSHRVGLGKGRAMPNEGFASKWASKDADAAPILTFIFRHRSKAALRAECILPYNETTSRFMTPFGAKKKEEVASQFDANADIRYPDHQSLVAPRSPLQNLGDRDADDREYDLDIEWYDIDDSGYEVPA